MGKSGGWREEYFDFEVIERGMEMSFLLKILWRVINISMISFFYKFKYKFYFKED